MFISSWKFLQDLESFDRFWFIWSWQIILYFLRNPIMNWVTWRMITQLTFTCSMSTIETVEKGTNHVQSELQKYRHWRRSGIFTARFEHVSHLLSTVSIVDFVKVNVSWVPYSQFFHVCLVCLFLLIFIISFVTSQNVHFLLWDLQLLCNACVIPNIITSIGKQLAIKLKNLKLLRPAVYKRATKLYCKHYPRVVIQVCILYFFFGKPVLRLFVFYVFVLLWFLNLLPSL